MHLLVLCLLGMLLTVIATCNIAGTIGAGLISANSDQEHAGLLDCLPKGIDMMMLAAGLVMATSSGYFLYQ